MQSIVRLTSRWAPAAQAGPCQSCCCVQRGAAAPQPPWSGAGRRLCAGAALVRAASSVMLAGLQRSCATSPATTSAIRPLVATRTCCQMQASPRHSACPALKGCRMGWAAPALLGQGASLVPHRDWLSEERLGAAAPERPCLDCRDCRDEATLTASSSTAALGPCWASLAACVLRCQRPQLRCATHAAGVVPAALPAALERACCCLGTGTHQAGAASPWVQRGGRLAQQLCSHRRVHVASCQHLACGPARMCMRHETAAGV